MKKAFQEIGLKKTFKFGVFTILHIIFKLLFLPPLRTYFLRLLGAEIGQHTIIHNISFFNYHRTGFKGLRIGNNCFLGEECLLDLAAPIIIEDHISVGQRSIIVTHLNVGYKDHPLQKLFPPHAKKVYIKTGTFIGANTTILPGVTIGHQSFIAASSLVNTNIPDNVLAGGVPVKIIKQIPNCSI